MPNAVPPMARRLRVSPREGVGDGEAEQQQSGQGPEVQRQTGERLDRHAGFCRHAPQHAEIDGDRNDDPDEIDRPQRGQEPEPTVAAQRREEAGAIQGLVGNGLTARRGIYLNIHRRKSGAC